MNNMIVADGLVKEAYNGIFTSLEKMEYKRAEKFIKFVEQNNGFMEVDMVDYAKVIIYSNTNRLEDAINLSNLMLTRKLITPELETVVKEINKQLKKQNNTERKLGSANKQIKIEILYDFLNIIKPSSSKFDSFLQLFDEGEQKYVIEYYETGSIKDSKNAEVISLKKRAVNCIFTTKTYNGSKKEGAPEGINKILNRAFYHFHARSNLVVFLGLYKNGVLKQMLVDDKINPVIRSLIAYKLYELYIFNVVGRIKVKIKIGKTIQEEYINQMGNEYMQEIDFYEQQLHEFFDHTKIDEDTKYEIIENFCAMSVKSFPFVNVLGSDANKMIATFLYVISNNNYNGQFNDIIDDVYNFSQSTLQKEMQLIEVLILN